MSGPSEEPAPGFQCRRCGCRHFFVVYTRAAGPGWITRRRECRHCGTRITTREREIGVAYDPGAR
jgi:transcriptional regulator NrdR family protein